MQIILCAHKPASHFMQSGQTTQKDKTELLFSRQVRPRDCTHLQQRCLLNLVSSNNAVKKKQLKKPESTYMSFIRPSTAMQNMLSYVNHLWC